MSAQAIDSLTSEAVRDLCGWRWFLPRRDKTAVSVGVPIAVKAWARLGIAECTCDEKSWRKKYKQNIESLRRTVCQQTQAQMEILGYTPLEIIGSIVLAAIDGLVSWLVKKWLDHHYGFRAALAGVK